MRPGRKAMTSLCLGLALLLGWPLAPHALAARPEREALLRRAELAILREARLSGGEKHRWLTRGVAVLRRSLAQGLPRDLMLDLFQTGLDHNWRPRDLELIALHLERARREHRDLSRLALLLAWRRLANRPLEAPPARGAHRPSGAKAQKPISSRRFVATLREWLGTPYRFGGKEPEAIDCSGFVRAAYAAQGLDLPDGSWNQAEAGFPVGRAQLSLGDILIFRKADGRVGHVGIYLGKGHFVHSVAGHGVIVSHLGEARFRRMYSGARRVARFAGQVNLDSWYLFS